MSAAVQLSADDLGRLVDMLAPALAALAAGQTGELLTKDQIAALFKVGPATIVRCVKAGMPCEHVGDLPRFDPVACRAWLKENGRKAGRGKGSMVENASEQKASEVSMVGVRRLGRGR